MNAKRDQNHVTIGLVLNATDNTTLLPLVMDPTTSAVFAVATNDSIVAVSSLSMAKRDGNHKPTYYGVSFNDGVTLVPIRTDTNGLLLAAF